MANIRTRYKMLCAWLFVVGIQKFEFLFMFCVFSVTPLYEIIMILI